MHWVLIEPEFITRQGSPVLTFSLETDECWPTAIATVAVVGTCDRFPTLLQLLLDELVWLLVFVDCGGVLAAVAVNRLA